MFLNEIHDILDIWMRLGKCLLPRWLSIFISNSGCCLRLGVVWHKKCSAKGHLMRVEGSRHHRHRASASCIVMAQPEGELVELVGPHAVLVQQHAVVGGLAGALDARVAAQVEVVLPGVAHPCINHSAGRDVATPVSIVSVLDKEPGVVSLLHYHKGQLGVVARLNVIACLADGLHLFLCYFLELSLSHTISVEHNARRLALC
mmetsp:Transcript_14798/g.21808  ORF Transcript_14798/g.21808 Transcript_14798/m.21808 type:complete len:203 (+) Transcript_14798:212-820(+)